MARRKKELWIKLRAGLLDGIHEQQMGTAIWAFLDMLHRVHWGTGVVWGYTDAQAAAQRGKAQKTVKRQRRKLEEEGYIKCYFDQQHNVQHILIYRWQDPRNDKSEMINLPGQVPETVDELLENNFTTQGRAILSPPWGPFLPPLSERPSLYTQKTHTQSVAKMPDTGDPVSDPVLPSELTTFEERLGQIIKKVLGYEPSFNEEQRKDLLCTPVKVSIKKNGKKRTQTMPPPAVLAEEEGEIFYGWIFYALLYKAGKNNEIISKDDLIKTLRGYGWRTIGWLACKKEIEESRSEWDDVVIPTFGLDDD